MPKLKAHLPSPWPPTPTHKCLHCANAANTNVNTLYLHQHQLKALIAAKRQHKCLLPLLPPTYTPPSLHFHGRQDQSITANASIFDGTSNHKTNTKSTERTTTIDCRWGQKHERRARAWIKMLSINNKNQPGLAQSTKEANIIITPTTTGATTTWTTSMGTTIADRDRTGTTMTSTI